MVKKIRLALYDREGYMQSLAGYLCKKGPQILETRLFTNLKLLRECVSEGKIDVLLAGEEVLEELSEFDGKIPQIILLTDCEEAGSEMKYSTLFKYQPAQDIVSEVLSRIAEDDEICYTQHVCRKRGLELVGVYAPYGGAGVTQYAMNLAKEFARQGKSLYISLEPFSSLDVWSAEKEPTKQTSFQGMSEVLFYLRQKKEKLALKLESLIFSLNGIEGIAAVEDCRDLYHMRVDDMKYFLSVMAEQTSYEKLVFDIGCMNEAVLYLMRQCSKVYMPQAVSDFQKAKRCAFEQMLEREGCQQIMQSVEEIPAKLQEVRV